MILPAITLASVLAACGQGGSGPCAEGDRLVGHLGITRLACDCTAHVGPSLEERYWTFRGEPEVLEVDPDGPAQGRLRPGDVMMAIDGVPIRSEAAGRRFAAIRRSERVSLTVRRDGADRRVEIVAEEICASDPRSVEAHTPEAVGSPRAPDFGMSGGELPTPAPEASPHAPMAAPGLTTDSGQPIPVPTTPDLLPEGWLGFGLACRQCGWEREGGAATPAWESSTAPIVYDVDPDGPAATGGLRRGDRLLRIDGLALDSAAGGEHFGAVRPGQAVRWTVERDGRVLEVTTRATERPTAMAPRAAPRNLRYRGRVGDVLVEVHGVGSVAVDIVERGRDVEIVTPEATVRIRIED